MIKVTSPAPRDEWRAVLSGDRSALPEHAPEWLDAACRGGPYSDASRLYQLPDGREFVLPLLRRSGPAGTGGWLSSFPPAWGIGGLVGAGQDDGVLRAVLTDLRSIGAQRVWLRPDPLRSAMWDAAADQRVVRIPRRAHVVDLTAGADAVLARMRPSTRKGLRKAARAGVRIEVDRGGALLPQHYDLYMLSVARWAQRQHEPVALARWRARQRDPLLKLQALAQHMGKAFVVVMAFLDDRPISSGITLIGQTAHDIRAAMDRDLAGPVRASELVAWKSLQLACEEGCLVHHLGESGQSRPLAQFKERFGAVPVDYFEYRLERAPYTAVDALARSAVKRLIRFRDA
jgi:hypothetical protein